MKEEALFNGIPYEFITEEMLLTVANKILYWLKESIPEKYRTEELYKKLIVINPGEKSYLPRLE